MLWVGVLWNSLYTVYVIKQFADHFVPTWATGLTHWTRCVEAFLVTFARNQVALAVRYEGTRLWQYRGLMSSTVTMCLAPILIVTRFLIWPDICLWIPGLDFVVLPVCCIPMLIWTMEAVIHHLQSGVHDVFLQCMDLIEMDRNKQLQKEADAEAEEQPSGQKRGAPPPHWNITFQ
ncbi:hypothetical protein KFL_013170010, partial [Klebsormidium nitens]